MALIKIFMDESGTDDESPVLVVSAYLGRPKAWRDWAKKWNKAKRPVKIYHAVDAQNLRGDFKGWTSEQVSEISKRILPVIADADIAGLSVGIDMISFRKELKENPHLSNIFGNPYSACFHWAVQIILNHCSDVGCKDRLNFYHEINQYKGEAISAFDWIRENGNKGGNLMSLNFGGKSEFMPLQAADILAYETNKRMRNIDAPARKPWEIIGQNAHVVQYGQKNMRRLFSDLKLISSGRADEIDPGKGWNRASVRFVRVQSA